MDNKNIETSEKNESILESKELINNLFTLGNKYYEDKNKEREFAERQEERDLQRSKSELDLDKTKFMSFYRLILFLLFILVAFSFILLYKNETKSAMNIITHLLTASLGVFAGLGINLKSKSRIDSDD
jgi:lipopolysaccharide export LptBFGC system permease protein LptF